jgi:hypothetical protein
MNFHTIPKSLIRQKKESRQDRKVDGNDPNFQQAIQKCEGMHRME